MAFIIKDRVRESTTTTGTSAISLGGTSTSFQTFNSNMSNGDTTHYAIVHQTADEWEVGVGTWNTGNTLTRTTVLSSSNSNAAVNFTSGTKDVFMTYPATKSINKDTGKVDIDALGINASSVSGFTVGVSVPSNALFTDTNTTYSVGDGGLTQKNFTTTLNTKLDGIEASATADQTDAEIRAAVEAASDSNVFTDADHTKLNAVEASADVTNTANVVAALTAGTNVSIAANGTISSTDTNTTYSVGDGGLTTNDFTNADHSKLDGIAASANNYTHPNHSGEVTSTADGATVIADNVVDEANLKVSNTPTNGYVLTAQSGNTGGLTWAASSLYETVGTITTGTIDLATGNVFADAPSANATYVFSNPAASGLANGFTLKITPSATVTITWPTSVDWAGGTAPDAPASGATNIYTFYTTDGGTTYYGFLAGGAMA